MKPTHLEFIGLTSLAFGAVALVLAAWLLAGVAAALVTAGAFLILAGFAAVRTAALAERKSP